MKASKVIYYQLSEADLQQVIEEAVDKALAKYIAAQDNGGFKAPLTRQQAAEVLQVSLPTLSALIGSGQIESFNIGRSVRIHQQAIDNYLKKQNCMKKTIKFCKALYWVGQTVALLVAVAVVTGAGILHAVFKR